jgi:hypothetical protein
MRNPMMMADDGEATAEGRLYNRSPRLACLPGVGCRMRNLPPKSGCISYLQGDCVCVGVIGFANRGMMFIQPLFGGSSACIGVTG